MMVLCCCNTRQQASVEPLVDNRVIVDQVQPGVDYSPTTIIVMCDSTIGKEPVRQAVVQCGASIIYDYHIICGMAIRKPDNMTLEQAIAHFKKVRGVVSVERDRIMRLIEPVPPRPVER